MAKSWSASGASHHPTFMVSYLTVRKTCLLYPPCREMGLWSWTVVVAINKLWILKFVRSWQHDGYAVELSLLKLRFDSAEISNLFCFTATDLADTNDGVHHEVMCRWRQLVLTEWKGLMMWEKWSWSKQTDCWGWVQLFANACVCICWRWGTSIGIEWTIMQTFYWKPMGGRQERQKYKA